jgi:hypothetical protein
MKLNYEMIRWWSTEDSAYVVDVPELPGCMTHGATRQAAINNAEAAIKYETGGKAATLRTRGNNLTSQNWIQAL